MELGIQISLVIGQNLNYKLNSFTCNVLADNTTIFD